MLTLLIEKKHVMGADGVASFYSYCLSGKFRSYYFFEDLCFLWDCLGGLCPVLGFQYLTWDFKN